MAENIVVNTNEYDELDDKQKILFEVLRKLTEIRTSMRDECDKHYYDTESGKYEYFRGGYNAVDTCQRAVVTLMGSMSVGEFNNLTHNFKWQT